MTKFLSCSLQASEPMFRLGLRKIESANGHPKTDIRFSSEVIQAARSKCLELGLDPNDTTAEELYHVLQSRIKTDDLRLVNKLRTSAALNISADGDVVSGMLYELKQLPDSMRCYGIRSSSMKSIFKNNPPKKAMKQLGYRSLDSFLKHESPASILAAAGICEGTSWQHKLLDLYKKLKPSDLENRNISLVKLDSSKWKELASKTVEQKRHNLICMKELGALAFMPLPRDVPDGAVTASLSLALCELNQIRAASTYLKLCQVRPDFGNIVRKVASEEPELRGIDLDQPVSWHIVQQYYVRLSEMFRDELFEPQIRFEDMAWHPIEYSLAQIEPSFGFWKNSHHLGVLHNQKPVSLNVVDAALNYCNQVPFEKRIVNYFQHSLWHELQLRYLQHDTVEQTVMSQLQPRLVAETVSV